MRNLLYGAIFLGVLVACQREPGYKITGSVPGTPDGMKVYLYNWNTPVDSGVVKGGKFVLTGKVDVPVRYQLWVDLSPDKNVEYEKDMRGSDIFVDNTDIRYETPSIDSLASRMSFHRKEVKGKVLITGSPVHDLYLKYKEKIRPYSNRSSEAWNEYLKVYHIPALDGVFNTREGLALAREMQEAQKEMKKIQWDFITGNPTSPVSIDIAQNMMYSSKLSKAEMDKLLQAIDPSLHNAPAYKGLQKSMEEFYPVAIGEKFKDIEVVNEEGKTVHLADYVKPGQYNMVEFWASWCGPCRAETPNIKEIYKQFGGDDFEIVSVAVWDKRDATLEAIKELALPWPQIIDAGQIPTDLYGINGIPQIMLFAPDGTIVARNLRGEEMKRLISLTLQK